MTAPPNSIAARVAEVRERVAVAAARAGRAPAEVTLVAVTKTVGSEAMRAAWRAGVRDFGESRVQEAEAKLPGVRAEMAAEAAASAAEGAAGPSPAAFHLIGHLQRNKAARAVELFDLIQTVDSEKLAQELQRRAGEREAEGAASSRAPLRVLVEVNVSGETAKQGVSPGELSALVDALGALPALSLRGLMTVGPLTDDKESVRAAFRRLRRLAESERRRLGDPAALAHLSMGMTDDYEIAVEEGSTLVRVGRAIFGERTP